jgi:hypothetical protein
MQFERAHDDGHDGARNMMSGIYVTKQQMLQLIVASDCMVYLKINDISRDLKFCNTFKQTKLN